MALVLKDRVLESSTSSGTGSFSLSGAQTGYQSFSVIGNGNTTYYTIQGKNSDGTLTGEWEVGVGTWSTGNTLSRDTVLESSNSNAKVNFAIGLKDVFCDLPAEKVSPSDSLGTMAYQNANSVAVTGGTIDNTSVGATTPSAGAFTYLSTSSTTNTTPVLSFNASNSGFASGATVSNSYLQTLLQNKSGTAGASTNYVLSNDIGTDSSNYGEFGMNSSVYSSGTPSDFFSINNGVYFSAHDGDVSIGSGNGYKTYFAWGTSGDKAHVINASGAIGLNTNITGTTNFGTAGQVLTSQGSATTPTWTTPTAQVYPAVGIPNSTGSAWGSSYSVTGTGNVVLSTRPTMSVTGAGFTLQDDTDNTKQANFDLSGLTTGTTYSYKLPAVSGSTLASIGLAQTFTGTQTFSGQVNVQGGFTASTAVTLSTVANNIAIGTSQTTGTTTIGGASQTGALTFGQSTVNQTINIAAGVTASGSTKTINFGNNGASGSTTTITFGSVTSTTTTTINSTVNHASGSYNIQGISANLNITGTNGGINVTGQTTGTSTIGGTAQTGTITFGQPTTVSQTINIANAVLATGNTQTINIGGSAASGSTTAIKIGSTAGTSTTTMNGLLVQQTYLVANLPTGSAGARSFVTNALAPTFGSAVVGGGAVGVPVYHDGTSWKVG